MTQPRLRFKREDGTNYPDWKSGIIGDYYTFKNGLNKEKTAFGKGTPIINYTDVFKNRLLIAKNIRGRVTLSEKEIENHSAKLGDVFFTRTSETLDEVGFCGALIEEIPNCVFSGFLLRGRPIEASLTTPDFAGYYFMTMPIRQEIISKSSITTRALTNGRNLSAVNIKMPCLEEQQKIADFLSTVDEIIAQSEAEVQNLEQQKKAAMQKIFSQEVRFRREDGTSYPNWDEYLLQDISFYVTATAVGNKASFVGTENMKKGCKGVLFDTDGNSEVQGVKYQVNDILVSNIRPYLQKAWKADRNGICSTDVLCIRGNNGIDSNFLYDLIANDNFFDYVMQGAKGTKMPRGDKRHIMNMPVALPCLEEQQKIADFLSTNDEAISYAKQELDKWKEIKKGLLQQMFA